MGESIALERHHRAAGGADVGDTGPYDVFPEPRVDLRGAKAKPLEPSLAAKVLVPLCRFDLARHFLDYAAVALSYESLGKGLTSLAWSGLLQAGFKQYVCFVRGVKGDEELVVVLPEGSVSWPVRQLTPEAIDFLEVQAL